MSKQSKKYGTYYGTLTEPNESIVYMDWDEDGTQDFIDELKECGVTEILFDIEKDNDFSDTIFFETDENTDFKKLLMVITNRHPHEFDEITDNHYRMWFD